MTRCTDLDPDERVPVVTKEQVIASGIVAGLFLDPVPALAYVRLGYTPGEMSTSVKDGAVVVSFLLHAPDEPQKLSDADFESASWDLLITFQRAVASRMVPA